MRSTFAGIARGFTFTLLIAAAALGAETTIEIRGVVRNESGDPLPGATLTLRRAWSRTTRTMVSGDDGTFVFYSLPRGRYAIKAQYEGHVPAQLATIDATNASPESVVLTLIKSWAITVTELPIDLTRGQMNLFGVGIASAQYIPVHESSPGEHLDSWSHSHAAVHAARSIGVIADTLNGGPNDWHDAQQPWQDLPEAAIEELLYEKVPNAAEWGRTTGGVVSTVSASGGNAYRASLSHADRWPTSDRDSGYGRQMTGGSFGGALIRDRWFFFLSVERADAVRSNRVETGLPEFYSALEGSFQSSSTRKTYYEKLTTLTGTKRHNSLTYAHQDEFVECARCGGSVAALGGFDRRTARRWFSNEHSLILGHSFIHDYTFHYARGGYRIAPHGIGLWGDGGNPSSPRIARVERAYRFPSLSYGNAYDALQRESRWQYRDNATWFLSKMGSHELKGGIDLRYELASIEESGTTAGVYTFARDQPFDPNDPTSVASLTDAETFTAVFPSAHTREDTKYFALYIRDRAYLNAQWSFDVGFRYEIWRSPSGRDMKGVPKVIPQSLIPQREHRRNLAPRLSVTWNPGGNKVFAMTGMYGLYHGDARREHDLESLTEKQAAVHITQPQYPDPYDGLPPAEAIRRRPENLTFFTKEVRRPTSRHRGLAATFTPTPNFGLRLEAEDIVVDGDRKILDVNAPNGAGVRPFPQFGRIDFHVPAARAEQRTGYAAIESRFRRGLRLMASYAHTTVVDNRPGLRYLDSANPQHDWGPSDTERRHRFVAAAIVNAPASTTIGLVWTVASPPLWSAVAGRDVNRDGFPTDLVPGTLRNASRNEATWGAVNLWRQENGLSPIDRGQVDGSGINQLAASITREFRLREEHVLAVSLRGLNLLGATNAGSDNETRIRNALSSQFGRVSSVVAEQQVELSVTYRWSWTPPEPETD